MSEDSKVLHKTKENTEPNKFKRKSQINAIWRRMKKNKAAMIGLIIISIFAILAIFAELIAGYDEMAIAQNAAIRLQPPSFKHWCGTDAFGRDIFARIIHGARVSLTIGLVSTITSVMIGGLFGATAAYYGGKIDNIIMRTLDVITCIPGILLALALVSALGPSLRNLMIAIGIAYIPSFTRLIRSAVLSVVELEFVEAAKACGTSDLRIIVKHILPNAIGPIIVQATMSIAAVMMQAAGLSFIGMGIQPPEPEWGSMLSEAREYMRYAPHLVVIPGMAIVLSALSLNLIGDGLRDALDPRLKN